MGATMEHRSVLISTIDLLLSGTADAEACAEALIGIVGDSSRWHENIDKKWLEALTSIGKHPTSDWPVIERWVYKEFFNPLVVGEYREGFESHRRTFWPFVFSEGGYFPTYRDLNILWALRWLCVHGRDDELGWVQDLTKQGLQVSLEKGDEGVIGFFARYNPLVPYRAPLSRRLLALFNILNRVAMSLWSSMDESFLAGKARKIRKNLRYVIPDADWLDPVERMVREEFVSDSEYLWPGPLAVVVGARYLEVVTGEGFSDL